MWDSAAVARPCPSLCVCACAEANVCFSEGGCVSFGETVTDNLEIQADGVPQETFDSTHVFVRQPFSLPVSHDMERKKEQL